MRTEARPGGDITSLINQKVLSNLSLRMDGVIFNVHVGIAFKIRDELNVKKKIPFLSEAANLEPRPSAKECMDFEVAECAHNRTQVSWLFMENVGSEQETVSLPFFDCITLNTEKLFLKCEPQNA